MRSEGLANRTAILAGSGRLPLDLAIALSKQGRAPVVLSVAGEADQNYDQFDFETIPWGGFGNLFGKLKAAHVDEVVFAGGIHRRPTLSDTKLDRVTLTQLPKLLVLISTGDDSILTGVGRLFEDAGFRLRGASEVAPILLAGPGKHTRRSPRAAEQRQIALGRSALGALGDYDVGQALVVCGRQIVAIEGIEGTDRMVERVGEMRDNGRLSDRRDGVLVKLAKKGQDLRMDLPTIGPQTISKARQAGLSGIAVDAAHCLILERDRTIDLADRHNIFIMGIDAGSNT